MGTVRLWLNVSTGSANLAPHTLWTRRLHTDFAPRAGDKVHLSFDSDEFESSVAWAVYEHFWEHDGTYCCQLQHMVIDPIEPVASVSRYHAAWWTAQDGRPEEMLRRGGWVTWEEWEAQRQTKARG